MPYSQAPGPNGNMSNSQCPRAVMGPAVPPEPLHLLQVAANGRCARCLVVLNNARFHFGERSNARVGCWVYAEQSLAHAATQ